jgi:ATP-dependent Clp protease ATP-binding subunit ClpC
VAISRYEFSIELDGITSADNQLTGPRMFERFTEAAKRVVFFARYEAAQMGSESIVSGHLLLGILRDRRGLALRILSEHGITRERVEECIESRSRAHPVVSTSVETPLSVESKRSFKAPTTKRRSWGTHP